MRPNTITYPPNDIQPVGIIEFVHGMCEHRGRYLNAMSVFNRCGFICAIADIKGHGENILTEDDLGYFGEDGSAGLVDDVREYTMYLKREFPKLPLVLFGHSMGSLIVRSYLRKYSREVNAVIISGSPSDNPMSFAAKFLIRLIAFFHGWRYRSPMICDMINGPFDKPFDNEGIINAWLTTDRNIVEQYNNDPLCGFTFTLNGYYALVNLIKQVYGTTGWTSKNPALPVMFMSGGDDPCRRSDKAFKKAVTHFKRCGYPNTYYKLYPNMRHELLNEPNNSEVFNDILKFLDIKAGIETIAPNDNSGHIV